MSWADPPPCAAPHTHPNNHQQNPAQNGDTVLLRAAKSGEWVAAQAALALVREFVDATAAMPAPKDDAAYQAAGKKDNGAALIKALFAELDAETAKKQITYKDSVCGAVEIDCVRGWCIAVGSRPLRQLAVQLCNTQHLFRRAQ